MRIEQQDWLHSACNVIQLGGECFTKYTLSRIINSLIPEGCLFIYTYITYKTVRGGLYYYLCFTNQ